MADYRSVAVPRRYDAVLSAHEFSRLVSLRGAWSSRAGASRWDLAELHNRILGGHM